jgi:hypothetical protein
MAGLDPAIHGVRRSYEVAIDDDRRYSESGCGIARPSPPTA